MINTRHLLISASRITQVCLLSIRNSGHANDFIGSDPHIDYQISQLSISCVIYDHNVASCTFIGKDSPASGPIEKVDNEWNGQLGPPQTITEINCICIAQSSYKARDVTPALRPGALTPALQSRQLGSTTCEGSINIDVTLTAPDGCYTLTVPISTYGTQSNPVVPSDQVFDPQTATLSISQVDYAWNVATCFFTGRDSPNSGPVEGDYGVDGPHGLGPPQTITEVVCVCNTQY